jgi:superfamily II DNA or RNA helicase|tara:strand:- start:4701 stop:5876 length:1176 start_codon:yes stop_codon:yes gene_type:complete
MQVSKVNEIKDKEQKKALNKWAKQGFIGSIIAGTGFGKSRCGVIAVSKILDSVDGKALVIVPTTQLQEQFKEEFIKWGYEAVLDNVEVLCYQSAYKLKDNHYAIVVCDEIHLGLSPEYRKFFENNTYDKLLCMTATLPEDFEYRLLLEKMAPIAYKITLDKCVSLGLVSPYEIICMPVELTTEEHADYKKANNTFIYAKYILGQFDAFDQAKYIMGPGKNTASQKEKAAAAQFYRSIRQRKTVVDHASNKMAELQKIVIDNIGEKILVFGGSNEFTNKLADATETFSTVYHSGKTKKQREKALEDFRSGDKPVLCSTKALNQGFDVADATMAVICGLTSKALTMIQRVGRIIRFQEDKIGKIIILYVAGSQEEKWLKSSVKTLKNVTWLPL